MRYWRVFHKKVYFRNLPFLEHKYRQRIDTSLRTRRIIVLLPGCEPRFMSIPCWEKSCATPLAIQNFVTYFRSHTEGQQRSQKPAQCAIEMIMVWNWFTKSMTGAVWMVVILGWGWLWANHLIILLKRIY